MKESVLACVTLFMAGKQTIKQRLGQKSMSACRIKMTLLLKGGTPHPHRYTHTHTYIHTTLMHIHGVLRGISCQINRSKNDNDGPLSKSLFFIQKWYWEKKSITVQPDAKKAAHKQTQMCQIIFLPLSAHWHEQLRSLFLMNNEATSWSKNYALPI